MGEVFLHDLNDLNFLWENLKIKLQTIVLLLQVKIVLNYTPKKFIDHGRNTQEACLLLGPIQTQKVSQNISVESFVLLTFYSFCYFVFRKNGKLQKRGKINLVGRLQLSTERSKEEDNESIVQLRILRVQVFVTALLFPFVLRQILYIIA